MIEEVLGKLKSLNTWLDGVVGYWNNIVESSGTVTEEQKAAAEKGELPPADAADGKDYSLKPPAGDADAAAAPGAKEGEAAPAADEAEAGPAAAGADPVAAAANPTAAAADPAAAAADPAAAAADPAAAAADPAAAAADPAAAAADPAAAPTAAAAPKAARVRQQPKNLDSSEYFNVPETPAVAHKKNHRRN